MNDFEITILRDLVDLNSSDDNVDIEIKLKNGDVYSATFFTVNNLKTLMENYKETGECASGRFVWAADMIVVEDLSADRIYECVADLVRTGEVYSACSRIN